MTEIHEGDIFRWRYKDESRGHRVLYHAKSRIAVAEDGRLWDTYWGLGFAHDNDYWSFEQATATLDLERVGNLSALEAIDSSLAVYYADADIINLRHPNRPSGPFYIRKGAQRSAIKMLAVALHRMEEEERKAKYATQEAARLAKIIQHIQDDKPLDDIWF